MSQYIGPDGMGSATGGNPTPPNQRHHGASASPPSMPTPPTEASLSAEPLSAFQERRLRSLHVEALPEFNGQCADVRCGQQWPCDMAKAFATIDSLTTENATLTARVSALTEALKAIRTRHAVLDGKFDRQTVRDIDAAFGETQGG